MKRHSTDVVSLVFGLLFVALAGWWAASYYLNWALDWHVPHLGWFAAGVLILLGLFGVALSLRRERAEPALAEGPSLSEGPVREGPVHIEAPVVAEGPVLAEDPTVDAGSTTIDLDPSAPTPTEPHRDERE